MKTLILASCVALAGCSAPTTANVTAAVTATISTAQTDVQNAINLYGIAKGIGQVAAIADPALGPVVGAVTATVDPLVAQAQTALNDATTDAAALEALAKSITDQADALTVKTAPAVTVVQSANAPAA